MSLKREGVHKHEHGISRLETQTKESFFFFFFKKKGVVKILRHTTKLKILNKEMRTCYRETSS